MNTAASLDLPSMNEENSNLIDLSPNQGYTDIKSQHGDCTNLSQSPTLETELPEDQNSLKKEAKESKNPERTQLSLALAAKDIQPNRYKTEAGEAQSEEKANNIGERTNLSQAHVAQSGSISCLGNFANLEFMYKVITGAALSEDSSKSDLSMKYAGKQRSQSIVMKARVGTSGCLNKVASAAWERSLPSPNETKHSAETPPSVAKNSKSDTPRIDHERLKQMAENCVPKAGSFDLDDGEEAVNFTTPEGPMEAFPPPLQSLSSSSNSSCGSSQGESNSPKNKGNVVGNWVLESLERMKFSSANKEAVKSSPAQKQKESKEALIDVEKLQRKRDQAAGLVPQDNIQKLYFMERNLEVNQVDGKDHSANHAIMQQETAETLDGSQEPCAKAGGYWTTSRPSMLLTKSYSADSLEDMIGQMEKEMCVKAPETLTAEFKMDCYPDSDDEHCMDTDGSSAFEKLKNAFAAQEKPKTRLSGAC